MRKKDENKKIGSEAESCKHCDCNSNHKLDEHENFSDNNNSEKNNVCNNSNERED